MVDLFAFIIVALIVLFLAVTVAVGVLCAVVVLGALIMIPINALLNLFEK